jgi:hypothetical protein
MKKLCKQNAYEQNVEIIAYQGNPDAEPPLAIIIQ